MENPLFANVLGTLVEEVVWVVAFQYEHDVGTSSISSELFNRHFKPVFAELTEMQQKIRKIRCFCDRLTGTEVGPDGREQVEFLGLDEIPQEITDASDETSSRADAEPNMVFPHEALPLKWQANAIPSKFTPKVERPGQDMAAMVDEARRESARSFFDRMSTMVHQAGAKKPINDLEMLDVEQAVIEGTTFDTSDDSPTGQISVRFSQLAEDDKFVSEAPRLILQSDAKRRESQDSVIMGNQAPLPRQGSVIGSQASLTPDSMIGSQAPVSQIRSSESSKIDPAEVGTFKVLAVWQTGIHPARRGLSRATVNFPLSGQTREFDDGMVAHQTTTERNDYEKGCQVPLWPGSRYRNAWDLLSAIFVINDVIRIPMEFLDLPDSPFLNVTSWMVRIFWTLDLFLNFLSGYFDEQGQPEVHLRAVLRRYAVTWMAPDVLLVVFDWIEVIIESSESETGFVRIFKSSRVLRILRALRLVRMGKALKLLSDIGFSFTSERTMVLVDIVKILLLIIAFTHVIACLWCGLGMWETEYGFNTWLYAAALQGDSIGNNYLVSCIWALSLFSGGTDFPLPQNVAERVFMSILLLICFVSAAGFVSLLTSATTKLLLMTSGPSKQMGELRKYLSQNKVSTRLAGRIQRNAHRVAFEKHDRVVEEDVDLLRSISEPLRTELASEIRGPTLIVHPFFACYSQYYPAGMRKLCAGAASSKIVMADDILFMIGERQEEPRMYFLEDGELSYQQEGPSKETVTSGAWIAEAVLWTDWMHTGTLVAVSNCQVVYVVAKKFHHIVQMFSNSQDVAVEYAEDFVGYLNSLNPWEVSDLEWDPNRVFDVQTPFQESSDDTRSRGLSLVKGLGVIRVAGEEASSALNDFVKKRNSISHVKEG